MDNMFAVYFIRGEENREDRYTKWMKREEAEAIAEHLAFRLSGTNSPTHTVRVLNGVGDKVWEMEVA